MSPVKRAYELGVYLGLLKVAAPTPVAVSPEVEEVVSEAFAEPSEDSIFLAPPVADARETMSSNVGALAKNLLEGPIGVDVQNKRVFVRGSF